MILFFNIKKRDRYLINNVFNIITINIKLFFLLKIRLRILLFIT